MKKLIFVLLTLVPWGAGAQALIQEEELKKLLVEEKATVVMDVRTPEEFAAGHIGGAKLLPFDAVDTASAAKAVPSKTTPVVVYCRSGRRSALAAQTLKGLGYSRVYDLGGLGNWTGPLVKGSK